MTIPLPTDKSPDFSLVLGGPIFQMLRRSRLSGDSLELLHRRIVAIVLIAWVPLLVLSLVGNYFLGGTAKLSFLHDIEAHVRLLVALPVLIAAELIVHLRLRPKVKTFLSRHIVRQQDEPKFFAAIESAMRLRNSVPVELGLLASVYTIGLWLWRSQIALGTSTWYAIPEGGHLHLTAAGYWYLLSAFRFFSSSWCAGICGFLSGFASCGRFLGSTCILLPLTQIDRVAYRSWGRAPTPSVQSCSRKARCWQA